MKKFTGLTILSISTILFLSGCVAAIGNRGYERGGGTLGQQLVDLQAAKEAGAITDEEFDAEKAKLLDKEKDGI